jgi:hypothetical protein
MRAGGRLHCLAFLCVKASVGRVFYLVVWRLRRPCPWLEQGREQEEERERDPERDLGLAVLLFAGLQQGLMTRA